VPPTRAIITGAADGIGRATALVMASRGAHLVLVDQDESVLLATCREVRDAGARVEALVVDLAGSRAAQDVVVLAEQRLGGLDAVVSNAGMLNDASLLELDAELWDRTFAVNVRATWLLARAAHRLLSPSRGAIVATGSIAASHPISPHGAYSPSKAALVMLVRQMAHEWGPDRIRCNSVSPGMVVTGMSAQFYADERQRQARADLLPLRRVGQPEDVARTILWLLGPDAEYVTGQDILVDGGLDTMLMAAVRTASTP
jgi:NAD(P)-dependent dehydrogenase (short-subunit alcohol dehydrogenase family)